MLNRVGVLIDHFCGSYAVTGRQESLFGPTSRSWVAPNPWRLRFKVVLVASAIGTDFYSFIDILKWPGMNQAFLFSLVLTVILTGLIFVYGKRRPIGTPVSWGEAMIGSVYAFFVMFIAYGVLPHQWLVHVQNELGWSSDKPFLGPGSIFKSQAKGGSFPFDINYLQIGDILVTGIYGVLLGVQIYTWIWWQKRGTKKSTEVEQSTYGRPLVKKA